MAHVNTAGVHVPLWLDSNDTAIGWGIDRINYPDAGGDVLRRHHRHRLARPTLGKPDGHRPGRVLLRRRRLSGGRRRRRGGPSRRQPDRRALQEPVRRWRPLPERRGSSSASSAKASRAAAPRARSRIRRRGARTATRRSPRTPRRRLAARHHGVAEQQLHAGVRHQLPVHVLGHPHQGSPMVVDFGTLADSAVEPVGRPRHLRLQHGGERQQAGPSRLSSYPGSVSTPAPAPRHRRSCSTPATAAHRSLEHHRQRDRTAASTSPSPPPAAA